LEIQHSTQPNPETIEKKLDPTHGSTQPMDNSEVVCSPAWYLGTPRHDVAYIRWVTIVMIQQRDAQIKHSAINKFHSHLSTNMAYNIKTRNPSPWILVPELF